MDRTYNGITFDEGRNLVRFGKRCSQLRGPFEQAVIKGLMDLQGQKVLIADFCKTMVNKGVTWDYIVSDVRDRLKKDFRGAVSIEMEMQQVDKTLPVEEINARARNPYVMLVVKAPA